MGQQLAGKAKSTLAENMAFLGERTKINRGDLQMPKIQLLKPPVLVQAVLDV
jgi:hypothetical protein